MQKVLDKYSRRFITNLHRTFLAKFRIQINNRIIYVSKKKTRSLSYNNISYSNIAPFPPIYHISISKRLKRLGKLGFRSDHRSSLMLRARD